MYNQYIRFNWLYKSNGFYNMLIHKYVIFYKFNICTRAHFQGKYSENFTSILHSWDSIFEDRAILKNPVLNVYVLPVDAPKISEI